MVVECVHHARKAVGRSNPTQCLDGLLANLRAWVIHREAFADVSDHAAMRDFAYEVGPRIFGPTWNNAPPVSAEARGMKCVTGFVCRYTHVPLTIRQPWEQNVGEIAGAGCKHCCEPTLPVVALIHGIPFAQKCAYTCTYRIPNGGPAKARQVAGEDRVNFKR